MAWRLDGWYHKPAATTISGHWVDDQGKPHVLVIIDGRISQFSLLSDHGVRLALERILFFWAQEVSDILTTTLFQYPTVQTTKEELSVESIVKARKLFGNGIEPILREWLNRMNIPIYGKFIFKEPLHD